MLRELVSPNSSALRLLLFVFLFAPESSTSAWIWGSMQPSARDMQVHGKTAASLNGIAASSDQIALPELQNGHGSQTPFDHGGSVGHDDFLDQMLSGLRSPWAELGATKSPWDAPDSEGPTAAQRIFGVGKEAEDGLPYAPFDESALLANRLRQYQISGGSSPVGKAMMLPLSHHGQQQMLATSGDSGFLPLPLTLGSCGSVDSPNSTVGDGLYNGFSGALQHTESANQHTFPHPQGAPMLGQNFGAAPLAPGLTQAPAAAVSASASAGGGGTGPPRQKVRARRGQATDPHSIAERLRRERIAERMKALQELVPNANKTDKASMLDEIIDYVKFLQLQVKVLSMSRLGGAAAVAPLVADMSSEGQSSAGRAVCAAGGSSDSLTVTEHQVAKLMEEDMGSAMQYLQGKGLCLMPISLASAISSATSSFHRPHSSSSATLGHLHPLPNAGSCDPPSSPAASALSAHSAMANGAADAAKDTIVVSKG
ncbi:bHLH transcription factor RHL1-like isoform X2 [Zingiber officinale]|uniref:BHLH domain-containing protein n=1 Tax=Zingiber officinale TaxID=94328 RepID=A0A8J5GAI6_ZINOF|nr:bHLH transcription factor RHL1-like isoform X2 [Zingiber officinale]KAG6504450.1 hypothetical protein ZIOFF_036783 [Zingiber officinale]